MIQDQIALEKLQKFLHKNELPYSDLNDSLQVKGKILYGYYDHDGKLVGSGGLELHGDSALLRSIAVKESYRGKHLGNKIVNDLVTKAKEVNIKNIFLLTETAREFFVRKGFREISRDAVPDAVRASSEFMHICPVTAVCMFYKLEQ